ncbi:retropepsin-like aspartic protease family protein [Rickettsia endosymbiont of Cardiosporidium cionae]|uniref:retropepsin-like aspartic protease family protein n=1 Tax=Rickettsia endosymbiont of Cardiosporidium cionae TaxID=2777155 RepID=UPI001894E2E3|nr:TIGR02281 family clan AA aspartic protease [Rickettsia endosymbiont of Cardiosporidium cionae]KAF8818844.1 TIGR02281 family clan AA aspartic protease [Rickettsia endosymbiont of Cardiosporidium cionae]
MKQKIFFIIYWIVLIILIISIYVFKPELQYVYHRIKSAILPGSIAENALDRSLRIYRSADSHFYIYALVNRKKIKFLVDTGATNIFLSKKDARFLGIDLNKLIFDQRYYTANGIALGAVYRLDLLEIGPISIKNLDIHISNNENSEISLLGMSVISILKSFSIDNDILIIEY